MPDRDLNENVKRAMHALSLDDERNTFHPQLWNEGRPPNSPSTPGPNEGIWTGAIAGERLSQVWFAGVHSDVGGGYPDDSLSYVALDWIMTGAKTSGVRFCDRIWNDYRALSDENGPIHDSRRGLGGYYRYNPRRIERLARANGVKIPRTKIHESVFRRIKVGQDGYAPIVLPPDFDVVRIDGTFVKGGTYLAATLGEKSSAFAKPREYVFNWVWARRLAYFGTLAATLALVSMPLRFSGTSKGACQSPWCFLSQGIDVLPAVLPAFATTWTDTFSSQPGVFALIAVAIGSGLLAGALLEVKIRDLMRSVWYAIPATTPKRPGAYAAPTQPGLSARVLARVRNSTPYRAFFRFLTHAALPFVFVLGVMYVAIALTAQTIFTIRSSWGGVCSSSLGPPADVVARTPPFRFTTNVLCAGTGLSLAEGATYRLTFAIPKNEPWLDVWRERKIAASPLGVDPAAEGTLAMTLGVPLRRHVAQPWYKPIARIGPHGSDEYPLDPKPSIPRRAGAGGADLCACACPAPGERTEASGEQIVSFASEIVARSSGELFLYVNDAIGPPRFTTFFYNTNEGSACVTVEQIRPPP